MEYSVEVTKQSYYFYQAAVLHPDTYRTRALDGSTEADNFEKLYNEINADADLAPIVDKLKGAVDNSLLLESKYILDPTVGMLGARKRAITSTESLTRVAGRAQSQPISGFQGAVFVVAVASDRCHASVRPAQPMQMT